MERVAAHKKELFLPLFSHISRLLFWVGLHSCIERRRNYCVCGHEKQHTLAPSRSIQITAMNHLDASCIAHFSSRPARTDTLRQCVRAKERERESECINSIMNMSTATFLVFLHRRCRNLCSGCANKSHFHFACRPCDFLPGRSGALFMFRRDCFWREMNHKMHALVSS